jgi:hypothetical protein
MRRGEFSSNRHNQLMRSRGAVRTEFFVKQWGKVVSSFDQCARYANERNKIKFYGFLRIFFKQWNCFFVYLSLVSFDNNIVKLRALASELIKTVCYITLAYANSLTSRSKNNFHFDLIRVVLQMKNTFCGESTLSSSTD